MGEPSLRPPSSAHLATPDALNALRQALASMYGLVDEQLSATTNAVFNHDTAQVPDLLVREDEIDTFELRIDRLCADVLAQNEEKIVAELNSVQGAEVDIGGYYIPDAAMTTAVMRPSATLNAALDSAQS